MTGRRSVQHSDRACPHHSQSSASQTSFAGAVQPTMPPCSTVANHVACSLHAGMEQVAYSQLWGSHVTEIPVHTLCDSFKGKDSLSYLLTHNEISPKKPAGQVIGGTGTADNNTRATVTQQQIYHSSNSSPMTSTPSVLTVQQALARYMHYYDNNNTNLPAVPFTSQKP